MFALVCLNAPLLGPRADFPGRPVLRGMGWSECPCAITHFPGTAAWRQGWPCPQRAFPRCTRPWCLRGAPCQVPRHGDQGPCFCFPSSSPPYRRLSRYSHTEIRAATYGWGLRAGHWGTAFRCRKPQGCRPGGGTGWGQMAQEPSGAKGPASQACGSALKRGSVDGWDPGTRVCAPWEQASEEAVTTLYHPTRKEAVSEKPSCSTKAPGVRVADPAFSVPLPRCHAGEGVASCSNYGQVFFQKTVTKQPRGPRQTAACFQMSCKLRKVFIALNNWDNKNKPKQM